MEPIDRVIRIARLRMLLSGFLARLVWTLAAGGALATVLVLLERLGRVEVVWAWTLGGLGLGALLTALVWTLARVPSAQRVAIELDKRADLRDTLSTALAVRERADGWSRGVLESARSRAQGLRVRRVLPIEAPRAWFAPLIAMSVLVLAWLVVPTISAKQKAAPETDAMDEVRRVLMETRDRQKKLEDLLQKAKVDIEEGSLEQELQGEQRPPEEIQRAMVRKLTSLTDQLDRKGAQRSQQLEALRSALRRLQSPGEGPMSRMIQRLRRGDLEGARKALEELRRKLESGDLSKEERAKLQAQLEALRKQLEEIARKQEQLRAQMEQALRQAGMSPDQARQAMASPEALRKALEQMQHMSPAQRQQLMNMMAQMQAARKMGQMGQMMQKMGSSLKSGQMGELLGEMGEMESMLSEAEMLEQELEAMKAGLEEAKYLLESMCQGSGMCEGAPWLVQKWGSMGKGSSDSDGQGRGPSPADSPFDFDLQSRRAKAKNRGGPIIASMLVDGPTIRGESRAQFSEAVAAGEQAASDALDAMVVPREYQNAVKAYFGTLREGGGS